MTTITTRAGKGSPLTHAELDANFTNLNANKLEESGGQLQITGKFVPTANGTQDQGTSVLSWGTGYYTNINYTGTLTGAAASFSGNVSYSGTLTGGTGVINIGSGQIYKDSSGNVGFGVTSPGARIQAGDGTAGTAALYIRAFGGSAGADLYLGQSGGGVYGTTAGTSGLLLQNAAAPLGIGTLQAQPFYLGTGGTGTTNVRIGIGSTGDIAINKGVTAAQAKLELAGGTFALTDAGNSWLSSKFDSQGVARNTLTSPSVVLNGGSADRPEIAFYRGSRTYPEFVLRENTTADSGGEIWVGNGQAVPIKTVTFNSSVVGILSPTTQLGAGDNSAAPGNSVLRGADGAGTNISGASITIQPGRGTGTGAPGPGFLAASSAGSTGTTLQTAANVVQWSAAGLTVIGAAAAIGYATGSGGTVTQATSKATGVTLNKGTGQITMNAASLAANTAVSFVLSNSLIAATDVPRVVIGSGGTLGAYMVSVDAVAAGSCTISLRNMTAGALTEAVVLNFALVKGATA